MTDVISLSLTDVRRRLATYTPERFERGTDRRAAVAVILRQASEVLEVLLIQRSEREGDPWSGQMAFPGGIVEATDRDARVAAERETMEEVGLNLNARAYLGRIDDKQGRHRGQRQGIVVSAYVYATDVDFVPCPNEEVQDALWVPLSRFMETERVVEVRHATAPRERFPGIQVSEDPTHVVWGLTRRFMGSLFRMMDLELFDSE